jgi:hypothetical protein
LAHGPSAAPARQYPGARGQYPNSAGELIAQSGSVPHGSQAVSTPSADSGPCPARYSRTPSVQPLPEAPRPTADRFSLTVRVTASSRPSARSPDVQTLHGPPDAVATQQGPQPEQTSSPAPQDPPGNRSRPRPAPPPQGLRHWPKNCDAPGCGRI